MATTPANTLAPAKTKIVKAQKTLAARIEDQLNRGAMTKKISVDELTALAERITKIQAFLS